MTGTSYKTLTLILLFVAAIFIGYVPDSQAQTSLKLINPATSSSDLQVNAPGIFDLQVRADTAGQEVNAFSIYLSYDDNILQVIDQDTNTDGIQPFIQGDFLAGAILENDTHDDPGNSIDKFQLDYTEVLLVGKKQGEGLVATIQFKAIAAGNTTVSFDFDEANARDTAISIPPGVVTPDVVPATIAVSQGGSSEDKREFTKVSGDSQTGMVNTELAELFVVMVSEDGSPLAGEQVTFEVIQGGGSFGGETSLVAITGTEGKAQARLTLGDSPTANTIKARLLDFTGEPLTFTATATPAEEPEYTLTIKSGNNQTGIVGYSLSNPLVVKVTRGENPAADVNIIFEVIEGDGKLNGGGTDYTTATDISGEAMANLTLGQTAGAYSVRASLAGLEANPITFTALAQPGPPHKIVAISGNDQKAPVETTLPEPLVVAVLDEFDNPISAHNVTFQIITGAGNLGGNQSATKATDADGKAGVNLTLGGIVGEDSNVVHALTDPPLAGSPIVFKASTAPVATQIRLILGNNQTGRISEPLANPFVVRVEDASGYAVPNTPVTFQVVQGEGSLDATSVLTDENGEAQAILTLGTEIGPQNNRVEVAIQVQESPPTYEKVTFVANAIAGPAATIEISSGNNQTGELEAPLPNPLVVQVKDSVGNAVENATVTFRLTTGAGLLIPNNGQAEENDTKVTETTDALGEAHVSLKAKTTAGNVTIQASLAEGQSVEFQAKVNPGDPDTLSEFSGSGQTNTVGKQLPEPLVVIIRDKYANPVPDAPVSFAIIAAGSTPLSQRGSISVEETSTDEMGKAATFLTLGEKAGLENNIVEAYATREDGATHLSGSPVVFTASATPDAAVALEIVSGNSQIGVVGEPLPLPLVVRARDQFQNPVSEAPIAFLITAGGGSLSATSAVTDANGDGSTVLTLGQSARTPKLPDAGRNQVKASLVESEDVSVAITADGLPDSPYNLHKISGDGQTGITANVLPTPFIVEITDKFGNPITREKPNRPTVTFTVIAGGGTLSGNGVSATAQLDDDGRAAILLVLGAAIGDNIVQVTADVPTGSPVQFRAIALQSGVINLSKSAGDNQTGIVRAQLPHPLEVIARDSLNQPISGQLIEYRFESGDGMFTDGSTVYETSTDSEGKARATPILGTNLGVQEIRAYSPQHPEMAVLFTVTAVHGQPINLTIVAGDAQTAPVMTRLPQPLTIKLTDAYAHPIPTARIIFTIVSGDGEIQDTKGNPPAKSITLATDEGGQTAVLFTLGNVVGIDNHRVAAQLEENDALAVIFKASAVAGPPVTLAKTGGDGQAHLADTTLPLPLTVTLTDEWHNPVPAQPISFEVIEGGGAVRPDATSQLLNEITIQTDDGGQSAVLFTLGDEVGKNNQVVRATTVGISLAPVEFNASALPDVLHMNLTKITPEPLSGLVGQPLVMPLTVLLQDRLGNPVATTGIFFEVEAGGGRLQGGGQTRHVDTDAAGKAAAVLILGERAGVENNLVTANVIQFDLAVEFRVSALPGAPARLEKVSGDNQTGVAAQPLPQPLVVKVKDEFDNPTPDVQVQFTVKVGAGQLGTEKRATLAVKTGEDGWAEAIFTVGTMAGHNNNAVEAGVAGLAPLQVVSFIASTLPDEAAKYSLTAGDGQIGTAGQPLPHPFVVTVTDKYDNPISQTTVIFEVTAGGGTLEGGGQETDKVSVITNEQGQALATLILGPVAMDGTSDQGNNLVRVTVPAVPDYPKLYFFASAKAAAGTRLLKISGDNQTGTVGQPLQEPLVVGVFDSLGNPAPEIPVAFKIATGGGTISFGSVKSKHALEAKTSLNGRVEVSLTLGTAAGIDSNEVMASIAGQQAIRFTASSQADTPDELVKTAGDNQIGTPGLPLPEPFVVTLLDRFNNPIANTTVTFKVTKGEGLLRPANGLYATENVDVATDAKGMAAAYLILPSLITSDYLVEISLPSFANIPPVTFNAVGQATAVANFEIISGDGQQNAAGKMLPEPLVVFASDQFGNPIAGEPVDFEVIENNGSLIPFSVLDDFDSPELSPSLTINTDAVGRAAVRWLLGTEMDKPNRVKATLRELKLERLFTTAASPAVASALEIESGNAQTGIVGEVLKAPLVVRVADRFGNPVANAHVIFAVIAGDGRLIAGPAGEGSVSLSAQTDVNGQAKAYLISGEKAGPNNNAVLVSPVGFSSPLVTFIASAVADVAYYLKKHSGDWQAATISTLLNEPIVVEVVDRFDNPVEDVLVDFVLISGDGSLSAIAPVHEEQGKVTLETDANGQAAVIWTLGAKAGANELTARSDGLINTPVTFTATAKAGGQTKLVKISGDKQIGIVGQEVTRPLVVAVVDAHNNPIKDAEVYFEVAEGLGSLIGGDCMIASPNHRICHAITDAQGRVSIRLILGHQSGKENNIVEARLIAAPGLLEGDVDKQYFKITAEADNPAKLVKLKGDDQRGTTGTTLLEPLVAIALDKYNNPVADVIVTFEALDNPPGSGNNQGKLMLNLGQLPQRIAVGILDVYTDNEGKAAAFYELPNPEGGSGLNYPSRIRVYSPTLPINQLEFSAYPNTPPAVEFSFNSQHYGTNAVFSEILEEEFLELSVKAVDQDGDEVTISAEDLPANSSFTVDDGKARGKFRWRPDYQQAGSYQIAFTAEDKLGSSTHALATIIVHNLNLPPTLQAHTANQTPFYVDDKPMTFKVPEGTLLEVKFSAIDPDGTETGYLIYAAEPLPAGATMDKRIGEFRWRPDFSQAGEYALDIAVSDDNGDTDRLHVNIVVTDVNHPPEFTPIGDQVTIEGALLEFRLYGSDADGDQIRFNADELPDGANLDSVSGIFRWTPSFSQAGEYQITFTVADSQNATSSETIEITVEDNNRKPVILPQETPQAGWLIAGREETLVEFTVEAFDPEDGAVDLRAINLPAGAVFAIEDCKDETSQSSIRTVGAFSWTPKYNQAGTYEITIAAEDSVANVTSRQVFITIENTNRDPEILYPSKSVLVEISVVEGEPLEFDIEAADPDGDRLICTATPLPDNASLLAAGSQSYAMRQNESALTTEGKDNRGGFYQFSWQPTLQQAGYYEIDFTVVDANGGRDSARAGITVLDYNYPPQFQPVAAIYVKPGEEASCQVSATTAVGNNVEYRLPNPPEGAIFYVTGDGSGNNVVQFSWQPQKVGSYLVTFIAQDTIGQSKLDVPIIVRTNPGDVNADNVVDILDLTLVARKFGDRVTKLDEAICDVNRDGQIDIADLVLIGAHFGESSLNDTLSAPRKAESEEQAKPLLWREAEGMLRLEIGRLPLHRERTHSHLSAYIVATAPSFFSEQYRGFQVEVRWDSDVLELMDIQSRFAHDGQSGCASQDGVFWLTRQHESGGLTLAATVVDDKALFDAHEAVGELTIAKLTFSVKNTPSKIENAISLREVKLVTPELEVVNGRLEKEPATRFTRDSTAAIHNNLHQNYPNPFNPDTWIPYQLSEDTDVSITIYDVNGDLIRTLVLGTKAAGMYLSKSESAYWDGRNETGEQVASGIYFYRIKAGGFRAVRKMMMMK